MLLNSNILINLIHVLSFNRYEKMCQSGEAVYKGRQLDEALSILDFKKDDAVSEEVLKLVHVLSCFCNVYLLYTCMFNFSTSFNRNNEESSFVSI